MKISLEELQKMKVVELKAELAQRNLDQRGVKAILVDRLLDAMANEDKEEIGNGSTGQVPLAPSHVQTDVVDAVPLKAREDSPKRSTRAQTQPLSPTKVPPPQSPTKVALPQPLSPTKVAPPQQLSPTKVAPPQAMTPTKVAPAQPMPPAKVNTPQTLTPTKVAAPQTMSPVKTEPPQTLSPAKTTPPQTLSPAKTAPPQPLSSAKPAPVQALSPAKTVPSQTLLPTKTAPPVSPAKVAPPQSMSPVKVPPQQVTSASPIKPTTAPTVNPTPSIAPASSPSKIPTPETLKEDKAPVAEKEVSTGEDSQNRAPEVKKAESMDSNPILNVSPEKPASSESNNNISSSVSDAPDTNTIEMQEITEQSTPSLDDKEKTAPTSDETEKSEEPMDVEENGTPKRKHGEVEGQDASGRKFKKSRTEEDYKSRILPDDEPDQDDSTVQLDWYKSDLNLKISKEGFLNAEPIVFDEFPWAYAGAKATHGFTGGKIAFQVKWIDNSEVKIDFGSVEAKHVLRVGWSDVHADLQLGESKFSYGYDSLGKLYNAGEIIEFENGCFEKGDTITANLDMDTDPIQLSFAKNGISLESKIEIPKAEVEGKVFFPHVLARNTSFEVNFGESETEFPLLESFVFVNKVEESEGNRIRGPKAPESKADCEFIMLCGLACCGKTKWAKEHKENQLDKHFQILGTSTVVERAVKKTTLGGTDTPKVYDSFLMKAGKFVEKLVDMAPARRRNYILDQSNCQPIVQRRKAAGFEGFKRRAVIIFPNDEEYQKRITAREQEQGKSVPKSTLLDMKATFSLPDVGEVFSEVEFPELEKAAAEELLKKYNKEGKDAGYGPRQQQRSMHRGRGRGNRGNFRGGRGGPQRGPFPFRGRPGPGGPPQRFPQGRFPPPPARLPRDMGPPPFRRGLPPPRRGGIPPPVPRRNEFPRGASPWSRGGFPGGPAVRGPSGPPNRPPPPRSSFPPRGGPGGGRYNPLPLNNQRAPVPQSIWSTTPPGNWGRPGPSGGGGHNPWVNHGAQVPDQGFGNWGQDNNWVNGSGYSRNSSNSGGGGAGGTWQGYGGQTYGSYGGGSGRR